VITPDLLGLFIEPLERTAIPYMITGGVASVVYGEPRFTRDIDVVLALDRAEVRNLLAAFDGADFYVPPREAMEEETGRAEGGHFNIIHRDTALRADVYLAGNEPLHAWALERRRRLQLEATAIWVAPLEYVILRKLQYFQRSGSDRHLRDIAMMLRISGDSLDREALEGWLRRLDLGGVYLQARRYSPD
jgi:Nucleotidyl transferase AbiEii toxin, Type IV TA system